MEYLEFAGLILIVLLIYIVSIKSWMLIADFIGKKLGISKLIYLISNQMGTGPNWYFQNWKYQFGPVPIQCLIGKCRVGQERQEEKRSKESTINTVLTSNYDASICVL